MATTDVSRSRTYPVPVEHAFDTVLPMPLSEIFTQRYAAIAPITATEDQDGTWGTVGQTRTVVMSDGARMVETLTSVRRPTAFGYRIVPTKGPLKLLVTHADGRWSFEPAGTDAAGVQITWSWSIQPRSAAAALVMPVLARLWRGYARAALDQLERVLLAA